VPLHKHECGSQHDGAKNSDATALQQKLLACSAISFLISSLSKNLVAEEGSTSCNPQARAPIREVHRKRHALASQSSQNDFFRSPRHRMGRSEFLYAAFKNLIESRGP
jgi:hypothetical protein